MMNRILLASVSCVCLVCGFQVPAPRAAPRIATERPASVLDLFTSIEDTVQSGGPVAAYALVTLFDSVPLLPTQPITLATGAAFGLGQGLPIVAAGQATAATLCFLVGRTILGPDKVEELFGKTVTAVATEFTSGRDGEDEFANTVKAIVVLRQSPVIPFSVGNYVLGAATEAPIPALVLGTVFGCLPLNLLYTATGAAVRGGAEAFLDKLGVSIEEAEEGLGVVGAIATVAVVYSVVQAVRKVRAGDDDDDISSSPGPRQPYRSSSPSSSSRRRWGSRSSGVF